MDNGFKQFADDLFSMQQTGKVHTRKARIPTDIGQNKDTTSFFRHDRLSRIQRCIMCQLNDDTIRVKQIHLGLAPNTRCDHRVARHFLRF